MARGPISMHSAANSSLSHLDTAPLPLHPLKAADSSHPIHLYRSGSEHTLNRHGRGNFNKRFLREVSRPQSNICGPIICAANSAESKKLSPISFCGTLRPGGTGSCGSIRATCRRPRTWACYPIQKTRCRSEGERHRIRPFRPSRAQTLLPRSKIQTK